jgi:uncharacterized protein (UPF0264 family)|tara:strand:- start:423 stop:803 length:381 start_codon:yes stop_codon:yes gene_type:complete
MPHPTNSSPTTTYLISATTTDVSAAPKNGYFSSIVCSVAGTVKVKGGGVYEYVDISDATDTFQNYIDPDTGVAFANDAAMNSAGDGFYQRISTVETDIVMIAGQTVYGRFDSLKSDGTFTGFAYPA